MYCIKCGVETPDGASLCPNCNTDTAEGMNDPMDAIPPDVVLLRPKGNMTLLALGGFLLSLVSFLLSVVRLYTGFSESDILIIPPLLIGGLVLSLLGLIATVRKKNRKTGMPYAIIGLTLSFISVVFWICLFVIVSILIISLKY